MIYTPALIPELDVSDLEKSLKFYTQLLGFRVQYTREEEGFVYLAWGNAHLMLEIADGPGRRWHTSPLEAPFGRGVNFQIQIPDAGEIFVKMQAAGSPIIQHLEEKWYRRGTVEVGNHQFVVADPDGYLIRCFTDLGQRAIPAAADVIPFHTPAKSPTKPD